MDTVSRWDVAYYSANNDDERGLVMAMKEVSDIMDSSRELPRTQSRDLLYNKNADEIIRPAENVHTVYKKVYLGQHTNQDEGTERKMSILNGDYTDTLHDDDMDYEKWDLALAVDIHEHSLFHKANNDGNDTTRNLLQSV